MVVGVVAISLSSVPLFLCPSSAPPAFPCASRLSLPSSLPSGPSSLPISRRSTSWLCWRPSLPPLTPQVAGRLLSVELQTQLHKQAALECESRRGSTPDTDLSDESIQMLVYHWKGCGMEEDAPQKAGHYLTLMGDRALLQCSIDEVSDEQGEGEEGRREDGTTWGDMRMQVGGRHGNGKRTEGRGR